MENPIHYPWEHYGGKHSYKGDPRIKDFFSWCDQYDTILELGSCEGGHTALLAEKAKLVLGVEGKDHLIGRALFAMEALGIHNVNFHKASLDEGINLASFHLTKVDAVFCSGLLYHLNRPWKLIREIAEITDRFYLATHCATERDACCCGYWGKFMEDGSSDDWAGITPWAFWFTLPSLLDCLKDAGFKIEHTTFWNKFGDSPFPMVSIFCRKE